MEKVKEIDRLINEQERLILKECERELRFIRIIDMSLIKREV